MTSAMRPGQTTPNDFEIAILERLATKEPWLREVIGQLHVLSRKFTGVGSFTTFATEVSSVDAAGKLVGLDDLISMPGVPNGMGAVLVCTEGRVECLEIFTYGDDRWDGVHDGFTIEYTA